MCFVRGRCLKVPIAALPAWLRSMIRQRIVCWLAVLHWPPVVVCGSVVAVCCGSGGEGEEQGGGEEEDEEMEV
jgi:hypothetical protein